MKVLPFVLGLVLLPLAAVAQDTVGADESDAVIAVTYRKAASVMSTAYQNYQNLQGIKNGGAPGSDPAGSGATSQPKYNPPAPPASNPQGQQSEEPPATSGGTGGFRTTVNRPPPQQNNTPAPTTSTTTTRTVRIVIIIRTGGGVGCPPH